MLLMWEAHSTRAINIILLLMIVMNRCGLSCQAFPFADEWNQQNDYRSAEAALATLEEMFDSAKMVEYELARIRRPNTVAEATAGLVGGVVVPAVEVPFEIRFPGLEIKPCPALPEGADIAVIGYIDAIMQNQIHGIVSYTRYQDQQDEAE
jgi:hypothetical protein